MRFAENLVDAGEPRLSEHQNKVLELWEHRRKVEGTGGPRWIFRPKPYPDKDMYRGLKCLTHGKQYHRLLKMWNDGRNVAQVGIE